MRNEQRRRTMEEPLDSGGTHVAELLVGATSSLLLLTEFLTSQL
jgi:hypothetical protein